MKSYHFIQNSFRLILLFLGLSSPLFTQAEASAITNQQKQLNESSLSTNENEVVIIDKDLPDQNVLLASLKPGIKIEYFDSGVDMFSSINNALRSNAPVKALHIVSHGASGMIFTTSDMIDSKALESNASEVRNWKKYFLPDTEILLYGCETSKGEDGIKFIKTLSELSTAKVAASDNPTGSRSLGADWILEQHTSVIKNAICFTENINRYSFKLAKVYVHTGATLSSYGTTVHNYFNTLAGHSSTLGVDNASTIPDLSTYSMVFINNPDRAINATEITNLKALINRGGRVVFVGEHSGFAIQNTNITNAVIALGGHLSIQPLMLDGGTTYLPNTNFNTSSPMMEGVDKLWGSAASAINIGGDATVLNVSFTDPTKIVMAQERLGSGDIVAWADVNFWDKISDVTWGTARFFKNILENSAANIISNTIATLTTTEAYSIGSSSAWSGGNISSDNGSNITQRGICWSTTTASPTTSDSKVIDASGGTGSFALKITGLSLNTKYYVRAFATNGLGTAYGNTISFTTPSIVNTAPTAVADVFSCPRSGTIAGNVMSNDFDDDGDPMTATKVVNASYNSGAFTLNSNGTFTYTNNGNAAVSDFFTYYLSDGKSTSSTVGVSISIYTPTTPPTGGNSTINTLADGTYNFKASDFTYNSSSGSPFNGITVVTLPAKGVLKYNGLAIAAGATCNDITKLVFDKDGDTGSNPFATFTFNVLDMAGQPSASAYTMTVILGMQNQTISFDAIPTKTIMDADFNPGATASSGLAVSYASSNTAVATIVGGMIHIVGLGSSTISVTQDGDATYNAATPVQQTLTVTKANQTITFGALPNKVVGDADFAPGATASSGLTVSYSSSNTAVASIVSDQIHIVGAGSCIIYANQAGDEEYNAAVQVPQTLTVEKIAPTVSVWPTAAGITYGQALSSATLSGGSASVAGSFAYNDNTIKPNAGTYSADLTFTPTDGSNYATLAGNTDVNVTKVMLTVTADSKSKVYGEANPSLTLSYSGFVNSETSAALTTEPTVASTAVTSTTEVGTYTVDLVASGGVSSNYTFSYVAGNFEVTKAVLTATADNQTKVYGEPNPTLTFQYSGWVTGVEALDAAPTITTTIDGTTVVGSYSNAIALSGGADNNYTFTLLSGDFEVTKAVLTVTADNQTKVYGEANPTLTFQFSGWLNGDDAEDLTTKPSASTTVSVTSPVGVYSGGIPVAGGVDENYNFSYIAADFSVTKATLTVTANNKSKIYGASEPILDYAVTGTLLNGDAPSVVTGINLSTAMGASATFGTHLITAAGGSSDNYDINHVDGTLTVSKAAALTVTANDKAKVYGEIDPVLDYVSSGALYYSDTYSVISGVSLSTATGASASFGTHSITASGGSADNYDVNTVNGTLSVSKAPLEAIADNKSKRYGEADPDLSITYSGFKYTDNADSLAIKPLASTSTSATSNTGIYPIVLSEGSDNNYIISNTDGTLTIEKASLNVTADNKSKIYGHENPEFTVSYTGFANEDNIDNIDVKPIMSCAAVLTSDAGSYTITVVGAADNNYNFVYHDGSLEILKADQALTMEAIPSGLRTTQSHELEATSTSGLPVRFESSENSIVDIEGNSLTVIKEGTVIITAIQEGNHNWNPAESITQTVVTLPTFDNIRSLFTPNNDGMNDYWYISDIEQYGTISVQIYNRFGKLLYKSSAYNNDWDGTYNGTPLPEAAYYYIIKSSEKGLIKGVVNIVR